MFTLAHKALAAAPRHAAMRRASRRLSPLCSVSLPQPTDTAARAAGSRVGRPAVWSRLGCL